MCMSVPQIAVLAILMSTSFGPTAGSAMSFSQMPGAAWSLTSAFMGSCSFVVRASARSADDAELAPDLGEGGQCPLELPAGEGGRHLRADARLALRNDREGEADDVHPVLEEPLGHPAGQGGIPE